MGCQELTQSESGFEDVSVVKAQVIAARTRPALMQSGLKKCVPQSQRGLPRRRVSFPEAKELLVQEIPPEEAPKWCRSQMCVVGVSLFAVAFLVFLGAIANQYLTDDALARSSSSSPMVTNTSSQLSMGLIALLVVVFQLLLLAKACGGNSYDSDSACVDEAENDESDDEGAESRAGQLLVTRFDSARHDQASMTRRYSAGKGAELNVQSEDDLGGYTWFRRVSS